MNTLGSVKNFFTSYGAAFNALDGEAVAEMYAVPSGIVSGSGYVHWPVKKPIVKNMRALCEQYRKKGFVSTEFEVNQFIAQGEDLAVADLIWTVCWNKSQEDWSFNTTYNLIKVGGSWKVLLCTAYSEKKLSSGS